MTYIHIPEHQAFLISLKAVIVEGPRALLLHSTAEHGNWELPGGVLDIDESLADGLVREVAEETTLRVQPGPVIGAWDQWREHFQFRDGRVRDVRMIEIVYRCDYQPGTIRLSSEHDESRWVTQEEMEALSMFEGQRAAVLRLLGEG